MRYLVQISIGPVQSFIAASRKTRDLAVGSRVLGKIAESVAAYLESAGAGLIFPGSSSSPAANVLLFTFEGDAGDICAGARKVAEACLQELVQDAASRAGRLVDSAIDLKEHSSKFLEWFAAWVPIEGGGHAGYASARRRVGGLMASRKAFRDFGSAPAEPRHGGFGRPKSPFDPGYCGVLKLGDGWKVSRGSDIRVKEREHLDAIGLVKRFGQLSVDKNRFSSTRKIAISSELQKDLGLMEKLEDLWKGLSPEERSEFDIGDFVFGDTEELPEHIRENLRAAMSGSKVRKRPYYAILHADGDSMGVVLDKVAEKLGEEGHREVSRLLGEFATHVGKLVTKHHGELVYAGGDDVLALAPLDVSVTLAKEIRELFVRTLGDWAAKEVGMSPSLTMGVAAVHINENLQAAVEFSRELERLGKTLVINGSAKNSIVIGAKPRGGGPIYCAGHWDEGICEDFDAAMNALDSKNGSIPRGLPYELRTLSEELENVGSDKHFPGLVASEVQRVFKKKEVSSSYVVPPVESVEDLSRYSQVLMVAHFFTREGL